jgi:hypothetical protein
MKSKKSDVDKYIEFLTNIHGLKLYWYQKQMLKMMYKLPKYKKQVKRFIIIIDALNSLGNPTPVYFNFDKIEGDSE